MKSENISKARELLSEQSIELIEKIYADFAPEQTPEDLALLNVLDPVTPPAVTTLDDTSAMLQVRTLKGSVRTVRLVRPNVKAPWKIDLTEELKDLQTFLAARSALEGMREQAGEYAASWKAFTDQLKRMNVKDTEEEKQAPAVTDPESSRRRPPDPRRRKSDQRKGESPRRPER